MSFIEITGMDEAQEPELAPEGQYDLRITHAEDYINDKGTPLVRCSIAFDGKPEYQNMNYWVILPKGEDQEQDQKRIINVKRFLTMFGVPFENGFEIEDLFGATADKANVSQSDADEEGNIYNELRISRLKQ